MTEQEIQDLVVQIGSLKKDIAKSEKFREKYTYDLTDKPLLANDMSLKKGMGYIEKGDKVYIESGIFDFDGTDDNSELEPIKKVKVVFKNGSDYKELEMTTKDYFNIKRGIYSFSGKECSESEFISLLEREKEIIAERKLDLDKKQSQLNKYGFKCPNPKCGYHAKNKDTYRPSEEQSLFEGDSVDWVCPNNDQYYVSNVEDTLDEYLDNSMVDEFWELSNR